MSAYFNLYLILNGEHCLEELTAGLLVGNRNFGFIKIPDLEGHF